ncbi:MAG: hypothetical protein WAU01_05410 [Saprospiraceae bacterium]
MKTNLLNFRWLFILIFGTFIIACTESSDSATEAAADEYAEETVFRTQESTNLGRFGCYELVFPITMTFADASTVEVASYDDLKAAVKAWRINNPDVKTRPAIALPYEVINADGEVTTVETVEAQRELRIACAKDFFSSHGPKGHNGRGKLCFNIEYPFTVMIAEGNTVTLTTADDRTTLHEAVKAYKKANPTVRTKPTLVFPVTVAKEDGTKVTVNSKDELKALKDSCK